MQQGLELHADSWPMDDLPVLQACWQNSWVIYKMLKSTMSST